MKTKFTIANKEQAKSILLNNLDLTLDDWMQVTGNPVFSFLASLFEKYYDLSLLSTYDAEMNYDHKGMYKNRLINQFSPDGYVSMDPSNDHLAEYYKTGINPRQAISNEGEVKTYEKPKIDGNAICKYTFCLDGYGYARELKREAKEFGKFTKISKIDRGTMMGDCFDVTGTLNDIKEFHDVYDLDGRGIYFEEDMDCEEIV
jgi:hypothetical protein